MNITVRHAKTSDAAAIHTLICAYAELDKMLGRSLVDIYENLQTFHVAQIEDKIVGCCALQVIWSDLAEIKSLAVDGASIGRGVGKVLVKQAISDAGQLGIDRIFVLTLEPVFFEKLGFKRVDRQLLPMKVWSDCARCPKQDQCDETALVLVSG